MYTTENIKDKNNNIIALLKEDPNYIVLSAVSGKLLGRYNKNSKSTLDASNNFAGAGNQVMRLLK
jgi:hypothetical protein